MNIIIFNLFSSFFRLSLPWTRPNTGGGCSTWEPQWMEMKQWKNLTPWKTMQLIISDPRQRFVLFYCEIELHILKRLARLKIYQIKVDICELFFNLYTKYVQLNKLLLLFVWIDEVLLQSLEKQLVPAFDSGTLHSCLT